MPMIRADLTSTWPRQEALVFDFLTQLSLCFSRSQPGLLISNRPCSRVQDVHKTLYKRVLVCLTDVT